MFTTFQDLTIYIFVVYRTSLMGFTSGSSHNFGTNFCHKTYHISATLAFFMQLEVLIVYDENYPEIVIDMRFVSLAFLVIIM